MVSPDSLGTACPLSGRNSTYRLVQISETSSLRACVESLEADQIVIVDDGSTDGMWEVAQALLNEGLAHVAVRLPVRSSKPNAINAGLESCTGEIVFIVDADTILDPGAIAAALPYFADPKVGGVSCDLKIRNEETTLITRFQAIEYATSITVGKQVADAFGIMPNVSGACGAFRTICSAPSWRLGHGGGRRCRFSHEIAKAWMGLAF